MINPSVFNIVLLIVLTMGVAACVDVREASYNPPLEEPEDAHPAPIRFSKLSVDFPIGTEIGVYRPECDLFMKQLGRNLPVLAPQKDIKRYFSNAFEAQGYDITSQFNVFFDEEIADELARAEYSVNAKIIDADADLCDVAPAVSLNELIAKSFFNKPGERGRLYLKIEWGVYDNLRRKTVYKTITDGYMNKKYSSTDGFSIMFLEAFSMATHNFATDQGLHDLIFFGVIPPDDWRKRKDKKHHESRPRLHDPHEEVLIYNPHVSKALLPDHIESTRKIAVLVQNGTGGHGSGFFITNQGHIITNHHVVGDALRVRVVTANRKEKLIAEVLRTNKIRDIALLKLENPPEDLNIVTAPIQVEWPRVSEDIYALGSPQLKKLQDTLTKGIVSAHRRGYKRFNKKLDLIQGDVSIHGGNSGGPLLDAYGNIVGVAVSGFSFNEYNANDSLNFFIPIEDALKYLDVHLVE